MSTSINKVADDNRIEVVLTAATQHAEDTGEHDHEVGDLQDVLRAAWALLSSEQRQALLTSSPAKAVLEAGAEDPDQFQGSPSNPVPSNDELLRACFAAGDATPALDTPLAPKRRVEHKFMTILRRWDLGSGDEKPMVNEPSYSVQFQVKGEHLWLDVSPVASTDEAPLSPSLQLAIEINNGLPCVHAHTNSGDEVRVSLFGDTDGQVCVRPGEGMVIRNNYLPVVEEVDEFFGKVATGDAELTATESSPQP